MSLTPISRRIAAAALAAALFFGMIPVNTAHAETSGLCQHLSAHQEGCSYAPAKEAVPCEVCTEADEAGEILHGGEGCTWEAAADEVPCTCVCLTEDCALYAAPTCANLEGCGEGAHNADCPLYVAPVIPVQESAPLNATPARPEAVVAVENQIQALGPYLEEEDFESEEFLLALAAANAAYEDLSAGEQAQVANAWVLTMLNEPVGGGYEGEGETGSGVETYANTYSITIEPANRGNIVFHSDDSVATTASGGEELTVKGLTAYEGFIITDASTSTTYAPGTTSFTMPDSDVTVTVTHVHKDHRNNEYIFKPLPEGKTSFTWNEEPYYLTEDFSTVNAFDAPYASICLNGHNINCSGTALGGYFWDCAGTGKITAGQIRARNLYTYGVDIIAYVDFTDENDDMYMYGGTLTAPEGYSYTVRLYDSDGTLNIDSTIEEYGAVQILGPGVYIDSSMATDCLTLQYAEGTKITLTAGTCIPDLLVNMSEEEKEHYKDAFVPPAGYAIKPNADGSYTLTTGLGYYDLIIPSDSKFTVSTSGGGMTKKDNTTYAITETATVILTISETGKIIQSVDAVSGGSAVSVSIADDKKSATFTMPAAAVTINSVTTAYPAYTLTVPTDSKVTVSGPGVTGTSSPYTVTQNTTVTLTPAEGYGITAVTLSDGTKATIAPDGTSAYFYMPDSDVSLTVTTEPLVTYYITIPADVTFTQSQKTVTQDFVVMGSDDKTYTGDLTMDITVSGGNPGFALAHEDTTVSDPLAYTLRFNGTALTKDSKGTFSLTEDQMSSAQYVFELEGEPRYAGTYSDILTFTFDLTSFSPASS